MAPRWAYCGGAVVSSVVVLCLVLDPYVLSDDHPIGLRHFTDYPVYVGGGRAFLQGEDIYDISIPTGDISLPFTYPPFAALLFAALSPLPLTFGAIALVILNVLLILWVVSIAWQACVGASRAAAWSWTLVVSPLVLLTEPVVDTITFGQINIILLAFVIADTCVPRLRGATLLGIPSGVLTGVATSIKLTPAVFGLYFLLRRDWKGLGWMAASTVGCTALAAFIRPDLSAQYWGTTLGSPERIGNLAYATNQSWQGVLSRSGIGEARWLWGGLVVVSIVIIAAAMRGQIVRGNVVSAVALNGLIALVCSPVAWTHHWVWAIVLILPMVLRPPIAFGTVLGLALGVALIIRPHWLASPGDPYEVVWSHWPVSNSYVLLAMVIAIVAAFWPQLFAQEPERTKQQ
ncbi:hypothetical membrane protein [Corynebacterium renale]|uniref:Alpha-1,2-mannosyltransferase n=1 Tax=Corynebacterium renale TaxID=1724 RepID=A0A2A9DP76_9CORY|nr:alpha-1,2-mannosyltransferase [Corynebacterium renale]SQI18863.1 hypothetical membrane protein [Corynebacterium renale]